MRRSVHKVTRFVFVSLSLAAALLAASAAGPVFSLAGPDAAAYGQGENYPVGSMSTMGKQKFMVGDFSHFDSLAPFHTVQPAAHAWQFGRMDPPPAIRYVHAGNHYSLDEYLTHYPVTGLLIAKDDQILYEGYQYARTDHDRFMSQSMSKTIAAMLAGIAVSEQAITSLADPAAKYVPELAHVPYGKIKVRDLLHMSSGMTCPEPTPDAKVGIETVAKDCKSTSPPGSVFHYSAADSQLLGLIVTRAVKMSLTEYLQNRIWDKIGSEAEATWTTDATGQETAFCCFNAVLRDYARFGRLLAFDGAWNGQQLIPKAWLLGATTIQSSDPQLTPGKPMRYFGYGYQTWIFPGERRMFALLGADGQRIFVDPQSKLILVQTAVTPRAMDPASDAETIGLWLSLIHTYGSA